MLSIPALRKALEAIALVAVMAIAIRFVGGTTDLGVGPLGFLAIAIAIALLLGLLTYVQATGRDPFPPAVLLALGLGGIGIWVLFVVLAEFTVAGSDWLWFSIVLAFPIAGVVLGIKKARDRRFKQPLK